MIRKVTYNDYLVARAIYNLEVLTVNDNVAVIVIRSVKVR